MRLLPDAVKHLRASIRALAGFRVAICRVGARKKPAFAGFFRMGDTGSEYAPESPCFEAFAELGEAESEALSSDATLRDLVRLWSTLSKETKDISSAIIKSRSS